MTTCYDSPALQLRLICSIPSVIFRKRDAETLDCET